MNIQNYNKFKQKFPIDSIKTGVLRQQAFERVQKNGLPTKRDEAWKFTSVKNFSEISWNFPIEENYLSHEDLKWLSTQLSTDFYNFVFVNGQLNETLSDEFADWISIIETVESDFLNTSAEGEVKFIDLAMAGACLLYTSPSPRD